jgi:hypothetical protein
MSEAVRVFIGSDIHNIKAERALIYSIMKNTSSPVEFTIMSRFGDNAEWKGWQNTGKWATCFSCFRWAIPAVCEFQGRAIYLDSDMIVLGDISELNEQDTSKGIATTPARESSVTVFDCSRFASLPQFQLDALKRDAAQTKNYYNWLRDNNMVSFFTQDWNCLDGKNFDETKTKLIHYTELPWQPWHPAPQRFTYVPHPHKRVTEIWHQYYEESFDVLRLPNFKMTSHVSPFSSQT